MRTVRAETFKRAAVRTNVPVPTSTIVAAVALPVAASVAAPTVLPPSAGAVAPAPTRPAVSTPSRVRSTRSKMVIAVGVTAMLFVIVMAAALRPRRHAVAVAAAPPQVDAQMHAELQGQMPTVVESAAVTAIGPPPERGIQAKKRRTLAAAAMHSQSHQPDATRATVDRAPDESAVTPIAAAPRADEPTTSATATQSTATGDVEGGSPVTITGCLENSIDGDAFRLTETDGVDAPRSRSWKSGFFRKQPVPVALIEAPRSLPLHSYVGRRIAATGVLTNHQMRLQSVRPEGRSCE